MTRRQLERAIVRLSAIIEDSMAAFEAASRVGLTYKRRNDELVSERATLLSENASLRADIDELESLIHRLVDDRVSWRDHLSKAIRKLHLSRFGKKKQ